MVAHMRCVSQCYDVLTRTMLRDSLTGHFAGTCGLKCRRHSAPPHLSGLTPALAPNVVQRQAHRFVLRYASRASQVSGTHTAPAGRGWPCGAHYVRDRRNQAMAMSVIGEILFKHASAIY